MDLARDLATIVATGSYVRSCLSYYETACLSLMRHSQYIAKGFMLATSYIYSFLQLASDSNYQVVME